MSPDKDLFDGSTDFESWREYREKRNRRTLYVLAIIILLLLLALAIPNSGSAIFRANGDDSNTVATEVTGATGENGIDGKDGLNGLNGQPGTPGLDGLDGQPGIPGAAGQAGPAGPTGPAGPAGPAGSGGSGGGASPSPSPSGSAGTTLGTGNIRVGTCDDAVTTSMKSRLSSGVFYFREITLSDIASACNGKNLDLYILDSSGNEIANALGNTISGSSITLSYTSFTPQSTRASLIDEVAVEIRN
jgi:type II secretory pathway pseudopilin PulG